jgi:glutamine amidotransferase
MVVTVPVLIVDYDAGNLRSVERALAHVGADPGISADPAQIDAAAGVVLPGVGAAADTMSKLRERRLVEPLREYIASGRPFLGVCMGLQALLTSSEEGGHQQCMDIVPGTARHFGHSDLKVPHMGWNTVEWLRDHRMIEAIPTGSYFYFLHSFYPSVQDPAVALGETEYGVRFPSVIACDNVVLTQFHPEKSGTHGLQLYRNFVTWVAEAANVPASAIHR